MRDTILAKATKRASILTGSYKGCNIVITAQAYQLGANKHPHFSVTADIKGPGCDAGGCLHEEAAKYWPAIKPIIALHLSNADDGEPMHAEGNGFYWMAGAFKEDSALGERYHGGNSKINFPATPPVDQPWKDYEHREPRHAECIKILADHLRINEEQAEALSQDCKNAFDAAKRAAEADLLDSYEGVKDANEDRTNKAGNIAAKNVFHDFINAQRERWQHEAKEGLALIVKLSQPTE